MIDRFMGDAFVVLSCQFSSIILQCGARLSIFTLNYWKMQSVVPFFLLGVCTSVTLTATDRRSVAVLCMLYKIRCNPMHPLNGALPGPYVPVRVTFGALVAHRYTYAPPRCRTSQFRMTIILISVSLWNDLVDHLFEGVGLAGFKSRANTFLLT